MLKPDRIRNMPAVHSKPFLADVELVAVDLMKARVRRGKIEVAIMGTGILEIVGAAEIILCSRPADRRVFRIAVKIELDLSFPPFCAVSERSRTGIRIQLLFPLPYHAEGDPTELPRISSAFKETTFGASF